MNRYFQPTTQIQYLPSSNAMDFLHKSRTENTSRLLPIGLLYVAFVVLVREHNFTRIVYDFESRCVSLSLLALPSARVTLVLYKFTALFQHRLMHLYILYIVFGPYMLYD